MHDKELILEIPKQIFDSTQKILDRFEPICLLVSCPTSDFTCNSGTIAPQFTPFPMGYPKRT